LSTGSTDEGEKDRVNAKHKAWRRLGSKK